MGPPHGTARSHPAAGKIERTGPSDEPDLLFQMLSVAVVMLGITVLLTFLTGSFRP